MVYLCVGVMGCFFVCVWVLCGVMRLPSSSYPAGLGPQRKTWARLEKSRRAESVTTRMATSGWRRRGKGARRHLGKPVQDPGCRASEAPHEKGSVKVSA